MNKQLEGDCCKECGAELIIERFQIGYAVVCKKTECRGNGDRLIYHLTPDAAEEFYRIGGIRN